MAYKDLPVENGGGGGTPAGGNGSIQINEGGSFASDPFLKWDTVEHKFNLGGLAIRALSTTYSLVDNVSTFTTIAGVGWDANTYKHTIIEYSLERGTDSHTGVLTIANTATVVKFTDEKVNTSETSDIGVEFNLIISGGNVLIQYKTNATGFNAFMRIAARQW